MTQVIENLELLKKLAPYLDRKINTEYFYSMWSIFKNKWDNTEMSSENNVMEWQYIKTLTEAEAIELLLNKFWRAWFTKRIEWDKDSLKFPYWIYVWTFWPWAQDMCWFKTKIEAIEEMIDYLIDKNILWTKN